MLTHAQLEICRKYPFLAASLGRLEPVLSEQYSPSAVDGMRFLCHPDHAQDAAQLLFHGLCHCLLEHVFLRDASKLACDLAVALSLPKSLRSIFRQGTICFSKKRGGVAWAKSAPKNWMHCLRKMISSVRKEPKSLRWQRLTIIIRG